MLPLTTDIFNISSYYFTLFHFLDQALLKSTSKTINYNLHKLPALCTVHKVQLKQKIQEKRLRRTPKVSYS